MRLLHLVFLGSLAFLTACGSSTPTSSAPGSSENACNTSTSDSPAPATDNSAKTATPIKHVVIIIGENRSFDNLFATYQPPNYNGQPQTVFNLLSEGIVTIHGQPGPNYQIAAQQQAMDTPQDAFMLSPSRSGAYSPLPQPNLGENMLLAPYSVVYSPLDSDPGLSEQDNESLMATGGFPGRWAKDPRFDGITTNGSFDITNYVKETDTTGDPVHRFYQMWQQSDCDISHATKENPSGCLHDLYSWVGVSVGWGLGGGAQNPGPPQPWTDEATFQGGVSMGFYNMAAGDLKDFNALAQTYALSDNYHQFMQGGTGPNSISIGTAAPLYYSDVNGAPATPPGNQIDDPNAYAGSNNWYLNDGFWLGNTGDASNGAYTNCADSTQPGVQSIMNYLNALPYKPFNAGNCQPLQGSTSNAHYYYLLNNQLPYYKRDGCKQDSNDLSYTVGPSSVPTIGDSLSANNIQWRYYGEGYSNGLGSVYSHYCDICNPFQYAKSIMTTSLINNLKDIDSLYTDVTNSTLPAVAFIKPDDITDGHPGTSSPAMFQAFVVHMVDTIKANSTLWGSTAIFITTDESGGLYDSGYIQPIDFFGDGPRIPLIVVSPYAKKGFVDHTYQDHSSLLKFIEYNWNLKPLSQTSRDNLPNPTQGSTPYVPGNSPAVGDLTTLFEF